VFLDKASAGLTTAWTTVRKMNASHAPTLAVTRLTVAAMTEVLALYTTYAFSERTVRTAARGPLGHKVARGGQQGFRPAARRRPPHRLPRHRPPRLPRHRPPRRRLASETSARP